MIPGTTSGIAMLPDTPQKFGQFIITEVQEGSPAKISMQQSTAQSSDGVTLHQVDGVNQILAILPEGSSPANPGACILHFTIDLDGLEFQPFAATVYKQGDTLGVAIRPVNEKNLVVAFVGSGEIHYTVSFSFEDNGHPLAIDDPTVILRPPT